MKSLFKILKYATAALILICGSASYAQTAEEFFKLGNLAYKNGDYKLALDNYESSKKAGSKSAELFFNMANAYAKLDKISNAELYYLRAIYQNPRLREAHANLENLAKNSSLELGQRSGAEYLLAELSETEWSIIAIAGFWFAVLLIVLPPLYGKRGAAFIFMAIVFLAFLCVGIAGVLNWNEFRNRVVAIGDAPSLRISPTQNAPVDSILADGQLASIIKTRGNFYYVETQNGKKGWANSKEFSKIVE